ncbi:hypothetical protein CSOJ01_08122 [Colletotrichum sojae]|uniref:Uncharacterized protein n=1 Tax=Colletotrichum sojae TaxID=2175907 RepID=A0A8H6J7G1_9PEZI|nr:hypothetical protein CSOJ01_08122 [Colletotrichum sojae]
MQVLAPFHHTATRAVPMDETEADGGTIAHRRGCERLSRSGPFEAQPSACPGDEDRKDQATHEAPEDGWSIGRALNGGPLPAQDPAGTARPVGSLEGEVHSLPGFKSSSGDRV